jgi:hypothetical protein
VWEKIGEVSKYSTTETNHVTAADDGQGNSLLFVSRNCKIHDLAVISEENTQLKQFGDSYDVAIPESSLYNDGLANLTPIGNRIYAVGDGSSEAMFVGKGPDDTFEVFPDEDLYSQEWSRFPKCQYFVQGPKKTIFAAGNPAKPLTVYISEPAGLTSPYRDTPYSTEDTTYNQGVLSTVDILGSNASKITALSTRGDQVVVHTDKGCHLLYAPSPDQASTGYRVEQAPATNFSAAVNSKVVSRASGALTYWVGHDGQVYKDEAASRGSEDLRSRADEDQANWKSKGVWEHEHPTDLSQSFAVYSPQSGDYIFFIETEEYESFEVPEPPTNLRVVEPFGPNQVYWRKNTYTPCEDADPDINYYCCDPTFTQTDFTYTSFKECSTSADSYEIALCNDITPDGCRQCAAGEYHISDDCTCYRHNQEGCVPGFFTLESCEAFLEIQAGGEPGDRCTRWAKEGCQCVRGSSGPFTSSESCQAAIDADENCVSRYDISSNNLCECVLSTYGTYENKESCETALPEECKSKYRLENGCNCVPDSEGEYENRYLCEENIVAGCGENYLYELVDCDCVKTETGTLSESQCLARKTVSPLCFTGAGTCCDDWEALGFNSVEECKGSSFYYSETHSYCSTNGGYDTYSDCDEDGIPSDYRYDCNSEDGSCSECPELVWEISNCSCTTVLSDEAVGTTYETESDCQQALTSEPGCTLYLLDTSTCSCSSIVSSADPDNVTTFANLSSCEAAMDLGTQCQKYAIQDCQCVEDPLGAYRGITNCAMALSTNPDCSPHWLVNCNCTATDPADGTPSFPDLTACIEALTVSVECNCDSSDRRYELLVDTGDSFCLDQGSGSGTFTECECIELGYTIT